MTIIFPSPILDVYKRQVFRTSDAFRIECIYLCGITATPPHPEMHKTALGAEFTVDWKYVNNAVDAVDNLKNEGLSLIHI